MNLRVFSAITSYFILAMGGQLYAEFPAPRSDGRIPVVVYMADAMVPTDVSLAEEALRSYTPEADRADNEDYQVKHLYSNMVDSRHVSLSKRAVHLSTLGLQDSRVIISANALAGWCHPDDLKALQKSEGVLQVMPDVILSPQQNASVPTLLPEAYYNAGINGQASSYEPGILDAGIDGTHPAFSGLDLRFHIDHTNAVGHPNYADSSTNPDDLTVNAHGTHIAGIIFGRGSPTWESHVGVAPGVSRAYNLKSGFRRNDQTPAGLFFGDALDNIDWGIFQAADDIDLLNFSWGITATGDDSGLARFFDAVVDDLNIPVTIAAGNGGPGAGTVIDPAIGYNVITVGATNDAGTSLRGDDNVTGNSARGPTPGGRKKPDVVAPGFLIQSPTNSWETGADYLSISGTSFAAPHALGAIQLIMDEMGPPADPIAVKALLIGSASPGNFFDNGASLEWDPAWGWGYINLDRAYDWRNTVFRNAVAPAGSAGDFHLYRGPMEPIQRAALVWNRHVNYVTGGGQPSTAGSLNNLNLRLYDHADNTLLDSSTSGIDNVEVVTITAQEYEVVAKVYASSSTFSRVSFESYGFSTPPGFVFPDTLPRPRASFYRTGSPEAPQLVAFLNNTGDFNAHSVETDIGVPAGSTITGGLLHRVAAVLPRNTDGDRALVWSLSEDSEMTGLVGLGLASTSYGESFSGNATLSLDGHPVGLRVTLSGNKQAVQVEEQITLTARVENDAAVIAEGVSVTLVHEAESLLLTGATTQELGSIAPGTMGEVQWIVRVPPGEGVAHFVATAEAQTPGGGNLGGAGLASVLLSPASAALRMEVEPGPDVPPMIESGGTLEVMALCRNLGPGDVANGFVELVVPSGFILVSGAERQAIGALNAGTETVAGRWLLFAPNTTSVANFDLRLDDGGDLSTATRFQIGVGQEIPPSPSPFATIAGDSPELQSFAGSADNDPAGLAVLSDGRSVFYNAQTGTSKAHGALLLHNPAAPGTSSLSVLATARAIADVLGTDETFSVNAMVADRRGNIFITMRIPRAGETDPLALLMLPSEDNNQYGPLRLLTPPGLPPVGILPYEGPGGGALTYDPQKNRLLIILDNNTNADDNTVNGIYEIDTTTGSLSLIHTFGFLAGGLNPVPTPGADPIGFTALGAASNGTLYAYHGNGLNSGDIVAVSNSGAVSPYLDANTIRLTLPSDFTDFPVRLAVSPVTNNVAILVADTTTDAAAGETLLAEWTPAGQLAGALATRGQLLAGTGSGLFVNAGRAFAVTNGGAWRFWSTRDNEVLREVPGFPAGYSSIRTY